jgi:hypothetical protein
MVKDAVVNSGILPMPEGLSPVVLEKFNNSILPILPHQESVDVFF